MGGVHTIRVCRNTCIHIHWTSNTTSILPPGSHLPPDQIQAEEPTDTLPSGILTASCHLPKRMATLHLALALSARANPLDSAIHGLSLQGLAPDAIERNTAPGSSLKFRGEISDLIPCGMKFLALRLRSVGTSQREERALLS